MRINSIEDLEEYNELTENLDESRQALRDIEFILDNPLLWNKEKVKEITKIINNYFEFWGHDE